VGKIKNNDTQGLQCDHERGSSRCIVPGPDRYMPMEVPETEARTGL